jgi:hypothetical protein
MATYQTYTAIGMREDLSDVIYSISPTDVPFMSSIGKTKATAVLHEWQTDSLAAASLDNFTVEGATASDATMSPTTRVGNRTQIALCSQLTKLVVSLKKPINLLKHPAKLSVTWKQPC